MKRYIIYPFVEQLSQYDRGTKRLSRPWVLARIFEYRKYAVLSVDLLKKGIGCLVEKDSDYFIGLNEREKFWVDIKSLILEILKDPSTWTKMNSKFKKVILEEINKRGVCFGCYFYSKNKRYYVYLHRLFFAWCRKRDTLGIHP